MLKEILFGAGLITAWFIYKKTKGSNPHPDPDEIMLKKIWKNSFVDLPHGAFNSSINL